jgi:uncharacterized protein YdeI (YjbR/CyaY-like superfamily)
VPETDPRIDAYIAKAAPFARPILTEIRAAFHQGCPELVETVKWGHPSFDHGGILGGMAAFKAHASFGFWNSAKMNDPAGILGEQPSSSPMTGKFKDVSELPPRKVLVAYVREAVKLRDAGVKPKRNTSPKKRPAAPDWFTAAIGADASAKAFWDGLTPGYRAEYVEWVTEAKREATRDKRVTQAVAWLAEGKTRNWKYKSC